MLLAAPPASAASTGQELGRGLFCVFGNLLYMPVKTIYSAGGGLVGGLAWLFSGGDSDVATPIWTASVRGDYVISPDHLTGAKKLEFIGQSEEQKRAASAANWDSAGTTGEGF
jgi:hypothetical protein